MSRLFWPPWDAAARIVAVGFVVVVLVASGFAVGKAKGVHEAKLAAWKECQQRYESARDRVRLVRVADPCLTGGTR